MSAEDPAKGFSFDLDGREMPDDHEEFNEQLPQYSAVATHHGVFAVLPFEVVVASADWEVIGNWTRFLKYVAELHL